MKKLVLLTFAGLLGYSIYSYNLNVAKNDEYYKETMSEIEAAFDRAKSQPENDSIVESEVEVSGGGGPEKVYSEEAKEYFREITLKTEFDGDRKNAFVWTTDMKIFVDGQKREYLMNELRKIVAELNVIIDPINVKIVSNKSESNYIVYFGSHTDFKTKYKLSYHNILIIIGVTLRYLPTQVKCMSICLETVMLSLTNTYFVKN